MIEILSCMYCSEYFIQAVHEDERLCSVVLSFHITVCLEKALTLYSDVRHPILYTA